MFSAVGGFRYTDIAGGDPYWNSVSFLENFEVPQTAFADASTNNFPITLRGASGTPVRPTLSTPFAAGTGGSIYYDGTASWMEMPANTAWSLGTGNFTFEAWVYVTNFSVNFSGYMPIVGWGGGSWKIFRVRPTAMNFQTSVPSNLDYNANWPSTMVVNTWYHVALVRSSTTTVTAYLNGVAGTPVTINASATFGNATDVLEVGYKNDPGYWWGYISNWRLVKGTAVYTGNFTPSTSPLTAISGTSGLLNFTNQGLINNSTFVDSSPTSAFLTTNNTVRYSGRSPFGNTYPGSVYYDGSSYLSAPDSDGYYLTGDFTVEAWVYLTTQSTTRCVVGQWPGLSATNCAWSMDVHSSNNLYFGYGIGGTNAYATSTLNVPINQWVHCAVARSGTSLRIFVNGVSSSPVTVSGALNNSTGLLNIGRKGDNSNYCTGYITNTRVVKGTALYTGNFTVPTVPLSSVSGTTLLNISYGAYQDLSTNGQLTTNTATNTVISTQQKKFGTQSSSYTATGYQTVTNSTSLQMASGDFTIEGWIYRNASGATHSIMCKGSSTTGWLLQVNSSNQLVWTSTTTALKTSTTTIPATTWTYFAITRSGTTGYMFINGTQEGSTFTDSTNYNQSENMFIGCDRSNLNGLNGYLDDIRITKGVARYTASFSAPTSQFPTSSS